MQVLGKREKSSHDKLRDRIAEEYRTKGYFVVTEKQIGNRRVDIYAENEEEALIIEVVDTHYSGCLEEKNLNQVKVEIMASKNTGTFRFSPKRLQVTIREDIVDWIDQEIEKLRFANRSHGIEYALLHLMEQEKKKAQGD